MKKTAQVKVEEIGLAGYHGSIVRVTWADRTGGAWVMPREDAKRLKRELTK